MLIQCKHTPGGGISQPDVVIMREQMKLWEPPRVDVLAMATTGRLSANAIQWIENHNQGDSALRIEMWPETHLELLIASRPGFVAEFGLR